MSDVLYFCSAQSSCEARREDRTWMGCTAQGTQSNVMTLLH